MSPEPLLDDEEVYTGPSEPGVELEPAEPEFALFERFAQAILRKRELGREIKRVDKEINSLSPYLKNFFAAHPGFHSVDMCGLSIFERRDLWVRAREGSDSQEVCDALRACGLGHYVKDSFSVQGLSKHVRGLEESHRAELEAGIVSETSALLPPELARVLNVNPKFTVIGMSKPQKRK